MAPLAIAVTDLQHRLGSRRAVTRSVVLEGLGISTATVPPGADIHLEVVLESISNGIVATGAVSVPWVGDCRRCLREVQGVARADVREIFERRPTEGETYPLDGDIVDLEPMVRDAALLALPLAPLCDTDCRGPAPDEFPATVEGDGPPPELDDGDDGDGDEGTGRSAGGGGRDPRWAALDQLRLDPDPDPGP